MNIAKLDEFEFLICDIANLWRKFLAVHLKELGITVAEWRVLYAIVCFPGSTQVRVAELVELEPQSLTRILDKLENHQWIEKKTSLHDRRAKCLYSKKSALSIVQEVKQIGDRMIRPQAFQGVNIDQANEVLKILSRIKNNLS